MKSKRKSKIEAIINHAVAEGKLMSVVKPVWRAIGKQSIAALKDLAARTPVNPALTSTQDVAACTPARSDLILAQAESRIQNSKKMTPRKRGKLAAKSLEVV